MSSISVSDISMVFKTRRGEVQAIDHVSLEIPDAHFACIVGASGCGKSTLLNIMGGLVRPSSGTVRLDEHPMFAVFGEGKDTTLQQAHMSILMAARQLQPRDTDALA